MAGTPLPSVRTILELDESPFLKGILHFRNNLGSKESLDPSKLRVCIKDTNFDLLPAKKSANSFAKI